MTQRSPGPRQSMKILRSYAEPHEGEGDVPTYGFRAAQFDIYPNRKPTQKLSFDANSFGEGGFLARLYELIESRVDPGKGDEQKQSFVRFDRVRSGEGRLILLDLSSGSYGGTGEVVHSMSGKPETKIEKFHAVIHDMRALFVIPAYGETGVLVSEVVGQQIANGPVINHIKMPLRDKGISMRVATDMADAMAWATYLEDESVALAGIELTQIDPSKDRTRITDAPDAKAAKLSIRFRDNHGRLANLRAAITEATGNRSKINLAGIVGLQHFSDDDFDEQSIVVVEDGRSRKINVSSGWPRFTYQFGDPEDRPDDKTFVKEACDVAKTILEANQVEMPPNWRRIQLKEDDSSGT